MPEKVKAVLLVAVTVPVLVKLKLLPEKFSVDPEAVKVPELEITGAVPVALNVLDVCVNVPALLSVEGLPLKFSVALVIVIVPPLLLVITELAAAAIEVPELAVIVPVFDRLV